LDRCYYYPVCKSLLIRDRRQVSMKNLTQNFLSQKNKYIIAILLKIRYATCIKFHNLWRMSPKIKLHG
jgi:hypothetical protein